MKIALTKPLHEGQLDLPDDQALLHAGYGYNAEEETDVDRVIEEIIEAGISWLRSSPVRPDSTPTAWLEVIPLLKAAPRLLAACQIVVDRWESGDLAEAARACGEAVEEAIQGTKGQNNDEEFYG